jgi:hypothetical protein
MYDEIIIIITFILVMYVISTLHLLIFIEMKTIESSSLRCTTKLNKSCLFIWFLQLGLDVRELDATAVFL